jgi:cardiolipin synthase
MVLLTQSSKYPSVAGSGADIYAKGERMWKRRLDGSAVRTKRLAGLLGRWVLLGFVLCLALIGFLHLTRGTAVRHVRGVASDGVPIGVSEPQFPLVVTMMTGAWLSEGNRVELALNGDGTYERLWADLRSARQSITLQLYYGAAGRMADTLRNILVDRARAGVRVFVLMMHSAR